MPKAGKGGWYAVAVGRQAGVYTTWSECSDQVKGFSKAKYKKFSTKSQAEEYIRANGTSYANHYHHGSPGGDFGNHGSATLHPKMRTEPAHSDVSTVNRSQRERGTAGTAFYAVSRGRNPGVYYSWSDCQSQVKGFQNPLYKKFTTEAEATEFCAKSSRSKRTEPVLDQKVWDTRHPEVMERSPDSSFSDFDGEGDQFSPTLPNGDDSFSFSDLEEDGEMEEGSSTVLKEIAALVSQTQSGSSHPEKSTTTRTVVYTDGSCLNQGKSKGPRRAGIGVYWGAGDPRNCSERLWGAQTNQRAELWAAIRALQAGLTSGSRKLEVRTDSQYTIKGITEWIKRWKKNDYCDIKGQPVKNKELFCCLDSLTGLVDVQWVHVKGHSGDPGNEAADELARRGAAKQPTTDPKLWGA